MAHTPTYETLNGITFGVHHGARGTTFYIDDRVVSEGEYLTVHAEAFAAEVKARQAEKGPPTMIDDPVAEARALLAALAQEG